MLVVTLRIDDTLLIGDDVVVKLVGMRPDRVRLGFTTRPGLPVHRKEVYEAIHRKDREAATAGPESVDDKSA